MLNPVVAMLKNERTGRWHPILFRDAPFPGGASTDGAPQRLRSKGHHTEGFDSREAAVGNANELADQCSARCALDDDIPWDGEEMPAMNVLYILEDDRVRLFT